MRATNNLTRRRLGALGIAGAAAAASSYLARPALAASSWPDRPVRLIVPFGAGGAVDTLSRTVGHHFPRFANGQNMVIENRTGAGGVVGGGAVATAAPDGYTLLAADIGPNVIGKALNPKLPYEPMTAFTPILQMVKLPAVVIAGKDMPERTLADIIAASKKQPDKYVYASAGIGNGSHLFMELLNQQAGIKMIHTPYRGGNDISLAVMRGDAQLGFPTISSALSYIREGSLRAVAVSDPQLSPSLPGIPAVADTIPGFDCAVWYGLAGPAGMPRDMVLRINEVMNKILALPEVRDSVAQTQAGMVVGGTPDDFAQHLQREHERWAPLIREAGITVG
ncbi:Bug family tripartite tricarboxylate transporter substrate binding protein [Pseudoroseomonas globiformis]|uniref:Bug family tripartite tricarboxylate transporter substrate binding protein n=1 Tax=Teichococcus globiformis TaxID=2307229 RepID=A0ABV7G673_9PROT